MNFTNELENLLKKYNIDNKLSISAFKLAKYIEFLLYASNLIVSEKNPSVTPRRILVKSNLC